MKLSTIFKRSSAIVLDPAVPSIAFYGAMGRAMRCESSGSPAEAFATKYGVWEDGTSPQALSRDERALLFGFLAEAAKQEGK